MISISIIMPVFNEEKTIIKILEKLNEIRNKIDLEIIVVNDGSTDDSAKIIDQNPNYFDKVKHLKKNQGKGKAVIEGLKISSMDYVFFQDADLEYNPKDLNKFIEMTETYKADLIMGSRFTSNKRSVLHFWHMLGNKFITFLFNIFNNTTFTDIYCCYCLFRRDNLLISDLKCFGWGQQAEILTYLVNKSNKIYETSVNYDGRRYLEGKKIRYYHVLEVIYWIISTKIKTLLK